ncbi:hypothetical protein BM525_20155 (plasmid) [Alteromonas mediterranea]|uniref:Adenylosuccinate synthase n=1 Tax=Alteromonas mediterranea TaxID=314275 RepID=A0AAC9JHK1_9ALTE|nr:hypothetical protein [Alteromonas mediterranea]APD92197.1 hypothetical protein BM524_19960 [Alteromonas mediterranea]APE00052.1 hypothetical protein BM525_20155 [Alteromonas mediterranea]
MFCENIFSGLKKNEEIMIKRTHNDLCKKAMHWLKRSHSQNGPGCNLAFSEVISSSGGGEIPDAIGFRTAYGNESFLIEVKVSKNDYLADAKKNHRKKPEKGMGNYRYYLAPEGLISIDSLPPRWGLIEVGNRNKLSLKYGYGFHNWSREPWKFTCNRDAELGLLTLILKKIPSSDKAVEKIKMLSCEVNMLREKITSLNKDMSDEFNEKQVLKEALSKYLSEAEINELINSKQKAWLQL